MTMPDYSALIEKVASENIDFSPAMHDVVQRVRQVGLHKVAAQMHGVPEFTLKTAAAQLGTALIAHHAKFAKIASGLRALGALHAMGDLALEKTAGPPLNPAALEKMIAESGGSLFRGAAKPPPIPAAARGAAGAETQGLLGEIGREMQGLPSPEVTSSLQDTMSSMRSMPPRAPAPPTETEQMLNMLRRMPGPGAPPGMPPLPASAVRKMGSLNAIDFGKMASMFDLRSLKKLVPAAEGSAAAAAHELPELASAGRSAQHGNIFEAFDPRKNWAGTVGPGGQRVRSTTMRGEQALPELPAIARLPKG